MSGQKKIKLFIDGHSFDKEFQGTRTFIKELYSEMSEQSDRISYYIGAADIENLKKEFSYIKDCQFVKYKSSSAMKRLNTDIPRIIKEHGIDIAHFQYIAPFIKKCKYIVTTHDILFNDFKEEFSFTYRVIRNFLFRYSITRADIKTTVSNYSRKRISYHYAIDEAKIHVIANGVSDVFYEPYNKQLAEKEIEVTYSIRNYILYVSRLEPRKNHILLLKTFLSEKLYEKGISLVFIGRSTIQDSELENAVKNMPEAAKHYFFKIDQVNNEDLLKFYRASRIFVYPSKAEGFGIPPLEAGAMRIPLLCSNKTAMSDFTFFGDHFFDPENEEEFKHKVNELLFLQKNATVYEFISHEIKHLFSWKTSAKKLLDLITKEF